MKWFPKACAMAVLLLILPSLNGCSLPPDKLTKENYDKLELGMRLQNVSEILGQPKNFSTWFGIKEYTWVSGERHIHAKFLADRAIYYSSKGLYSAAQTGEPPAGHLSR